MRKIYDDLPKLKVDFSLSKFIATIVAVNLFLILPISLIESSRNDTTNNTVAVADDGRVLGLESSVTASENTEYVLFGVPFNPNSESGLLITLGVILLGISVLILTFLVVDNQRSKKLNKY